MVECFKPFLRHLVSSGQSHKTIRSHRDNLWILGGEIISKLHEDPRLRKRPTDQTLLAKPGYTRASCSGGGNWPMCSLASQTSRKPASMNCCPGIGVPSKHALDTRVDHGRHRTRLHHRLRRRNARRG
jgi:hypothetical protein